MQNTSNSSYINIKKIVNLKSEVLFREAEDDFFYFNKITSAQKKLKMAVELTPCHIKSLMLLADIYFIKGFVNKALLTYQTAFLYGEHSTRCVASIANCYYSLKNFSKSIEFIDVAIENIKQEEYSLYSQLLEIKINSLVEMKKYKQAYVTYIKAQNIIDSVSLKNIHSSNYELINEKLKLQKKLRQSRLKIV